jgi:hypothetical protein
MSAHDPYKHFGHVFASVHIGDHHKPVGWMYREASDSQSDSGWRFFSGEETQQFADDPANTKIYAVTTIIDIDPTIEPYLSASEGSAFERIPGSAHFT